MAEKEKYIPVEMKTLIEVTYCKDCKWMREQFDSDCGDPYWICKVWDASVDYEGYCYEAERRE